MYPAVTAPEEGVPPNAVVHLRGQGLCERAADGEPGTPKCHLERIVLHLPGHLRPRPEEQHLRMVKSAQPRDVN
jgi:hypothetical protein